MRKIIVAIAVLGLLNTGCAWLGFGDDSSNTQAEENAPLQQDAAEPDPTPKTEVKQSADSKKATAKSKAKTTRSTAKGKKTEAQIKAELDQMGHKLVAQSARTLLPNKAHKEVIKSGNGWIARYMNVNTNNVSTEMRPGANGQYVGFIRYQEEIMECRGATREAALAAPCQQVGARKLNELIRYDGNAWQD